MRRLRRPIRGQAIVEFALVLPLLLLLLFGLIDLGRLVYTNNSLAQAAREGSRWGSVQGRYANFSDIEDYTEGRLTSVDSATATVDCQLQGLYTSCSVNDILIVTVETDHEFITPIIAQLMGAIGANPMHLDAESQVIVNH